MRILLAGIVAAVIIATAVAWVRRPSLPGDWFQLSVGDRIMAQPHHASGDFLMGPVAKGEGWG